jgi:hypothetical protein
MLEACREEPACSESAKTRRARSHGAAGVLSFSAAATGGEVGDCSAATQPGGFLRFFRIRRVVQPKL